jgi:hypothetical protein
MINKNYSSSLAKVIFLVFILLTFSTSFAFAYKGDGTGENALSLLDNSGLPKILNTILKFFSSGYMKAIVSIALGALGIGMIMNRGEPGLVKKFIPWIAGCVLLLSLSTIVGMMGNWD